VRCLPFRVTHFGLPGVFVHSLSPLFYFALCWFAPGDDHYRSFAFQESLGVTLPPWVGVQFSALFSSSFPLMGGLDAFRDDRPAPVFLSSITTRLIRVGSSLHFTTKAWNGSFSPPPGASLT